MYRLVCKKPAHFLSAQMALVSTFFLMFIVLGMHNFAYVPETILVNNIEPFGRTSSLTKAGLLEPGAVGAAPLQILAD